MMRRSSALVAVLVVIAAVVAVSPFASSSPDGLEKVADDEGFAVLAEPHLLEDGPVADYRVAAVGDGWAATALAGLLGVGLILVLTALAARLTRRRTPATPTP